MCRGTTCFRSGDQANVVKSSWTSDKRPPEADHLRLAHENGVERIPKIIGYQRIISISALRSGLSFSSPHRFRDGIASIFTSFSQTQQGQSFGPVQNLSVSKTSSKRKRVGDDRGSQKRSGSDTQEYEATQTSDEPVVSLYYSSDDKYSNRIYGCLVIAPVGRALSEFTQRPQFTNSVPSFVRELLTILRDPIKAHRSLYLKGNNIHKDIPENNIIITNPNETGGFTGMLIDFDLANMRRTTSDGHDGIHGY